jgi:hypothetical protein
MRTRVRGWLYCAGALLATAVMQAPAAAGPTLIATRPQATAGSDEVTFFVGGVDETGRSLKASSLELIVDGKRADMPVSSQALSDWATAAAEASTTWRPPLAVGLVYLWIEGVPAGVLDGIHTFFQRIPSRTVVYPTIYGRLRQGRARLTAAEISRLDELPYLEGYRPNLLEAVRLDLGDLGADPAPLKILLLITDGRDFADPKGDGPGDFAALGRQIRKAGVTAFVVGIPAPEADAAQAAANLRDLSDAAGGYLRVLDRVEDIENTIESLGQGLADVQRVQMPTPWTWRLFGDTHRISVRLTAMGGQRLNADVGTMTTGAGGLRWLVLAILGLVLAAGGVALFVMRRRREAPPDDDDEALIALHDLVRRGMPPAKAAAELSQEHPDLLTVLEEREATLYTDARFPYIKTRAGRRRVQEIREILAQKASDRPALKGTLAKALAEVVSNHLTPEEAAKALHGRTTADSREAFVDLDMEQLTDALRAAAGAHPTLNSPRARGVAMAIQDALRSGDNRAQGTTVAWLARAAGPGRRGETVRLIAPRSVLGTAPSCNVKLTEDPAVEPEHAELTLDADDFSIAPLGGPIKVEQQPVTQRQVLVDGETIEIGISLYVFKCARIGRALPRAGHRPTVSRSRAS